MGDISAQLSSMMARLPEDVQRKIQTEVDSAESDKKFAIYQSRVEDEFKKMNSGFAKQSSWSGTGNTSVAAEDGWGADGGRLTKDAAANGSSMPASSQADSATNNNAALQGAYQQGAAAFHSGLYGGLSSGNMGAYPTLANPAMTQQMMMMRGQMTPAMQHYWMMQHQMQMHQHMQTQAAAPSTPTVPTQQGHQTFDRWVSKVKDSFEIVVMCIANPTEQEDFKKKLDDYIAARKLEWAQTGDIKSRDWSQVGVPTEDQIRKNLTMKLAPETSLVSPTAAATAAAPQAGFGQGAPQQSGFGAQLGFGQRGFGQKGFGHQYPSYNGGHQAGFNGQAGSMFDQRLGMPAVPKSSGTGGGAGVGFLPGSTGSNASNRVWSKDNSQQQGNKVKGRKGATTFGGANNPNLAPLGGGLGVGANGPLSSAFSAGGALATGSGFSGFSSAAANSKFSESFAEVASSSSNAAPPKSFNSAHSSNHKGMNPNNIPLKKFNFESRLVTPESSPDSKNPPTLKRQTSKYDTSRDPPSRDRRDSRDRNRRDADRYGDRDGDRKRRRRDSRGRRSRSRSRGRSDSRRGRSERDSRTSPLKSATVPKAGSSIPTSTGGATMGPPTLHRRVGDNEWETMESGATAGASSSGNRYGSTNSTGSVGAGPPVGTDKIGAGGGNRLDIRQPWALGNRTWSRQQSQVETIPDGFINILKIDEIVDRPAVHETENMKTWMKQEVLRVLNELGGPYPQDKSADMGKLVTLEIKKRHGINLPTIKQIIGMVPSKFIGQYRQYMMGKPNIIEGTKKEEDLVGTEAYNANLQVNMYKNLNAEVDEMEDQRLKQRANRFQTAASWASNAAGDKNNASWGEEAWGDVDEDADVKTLDDKPLIGELDAMCAREEINTRQQTRQLDRFEIMPDSILDPNKPPLACPENCIKKYQRSSADKMYKAQDIRTLGACWRSAQYLFKEMIDLDIKPKPGRFVFKTNIPYIQIYSFMRDRLRAIRVDLHVQQPMSTTTKEYIETHECAFRFELLSNFIVKGSYVSDVAASKKDKGVETYDEKLAMKAVSQTIEPLLNAYRTSREKQTASKGNGKGEFPSGATEDHNPPYMSEREACIRRYAMLLQIANSEQLLSQMARLDPELLRKKQIKEALDVFGSFQANDTTGFFKFYRKCDFLSAICISNKVDMMRYRQLLCYIKACHGGIGDETPLAKMMEALCLVNHSHARKYFEFCGLEVKKKANAWSLVIPKRPVIMQKGFFLGKDGKVVHESHADIMEAMRPFHEAYGILDPMVTQKFGELDEEDITRSDILFGRIDPGWHECRSQQNTPRGTQNGTSATTNQNCTKKTIKINVGGSAPQNKKEGMKIDESPSSKRKAVEGRHAEAAESWEGDDGKGRHIDEKVGGIDALHIDEENGKKSDVNKTSPNGKVILIGNGSSSSSENPAALSSGANGAATWNGKIVLKSAKESARDSTTPKTTPSPMKLGGRSSPRGDGGRDKTHRENSHDDSRPRSRERRSPHGKKVTLTARRSPRPNRPSDSSSSPVDSAL